MEVTEAFRGSNIKTNIVPRDLNLAKPQHRICLDCLTSFYNYECYNSCFRRSIISYTHKMDFPAIQLFRRIYR